MRKFLARALMFVSMVVLCTMSAGAYLDPSAMTYLIQVIAGVAIAGGAAVVIYWKKIKLFFKKRKQGKEDAAAGLNTPSETVQAAKGEQDTGETVKIDLDSLDEKP